MGKEIAAKIEANKGKAALTRKDKQANREAVKKLAALHMEAAIKKLSEIVADKKRASFSKSRCSNSAPGSCRGQTATDRRA